MFGCGGFGAGNANTFGHGGSSSGGAGNANILGCGGDGAGWNEHQMMQNQEIILHVLQQQSLQSANK